MHLVPPHGHAKKWAIRLRNHDGKVVKVQGDRDRDDTVRIAERVQMLVRAKQHGDPPPAELASWLDNMPPVLANRLVELGLLSPRRLARSKPLTEHVKTYGSIVAARRSNKKRHAEQQEKKVRRVCEALNAERFDDLTAEGLLRYLATLKIATSTRRAYIIAMKDFGDEMTRIGVAKENPFKHVQAPGQYENPERERQPLTVAQFRTLMKYLDGFVRYKGQHSRWTAYDRKMIYWTAVKTAYRQSELRALRKANLYLDGEPPVISLKARHTKNKTDGEVPIPNDLARALKRYVAKLDPIDPVFPLPVTSGSIVDMMRRDLTAAGIPWKLPTGEVVDFHTLRSTAITWWLDVDGLSPKRVQVLARLKTLALVQRYSRNLRIEEFEWLNKGPKLIPRKPRAAG